MPQYPKLDQKTFDYLPEPFKQAIIADGRRPVNPYGNVDKVITVDQMKEYKHNRDKWLDERSRISQGCENVISEMKKGS